MGCVVYYGGYIVRLDGTNLSDEEAKSIFEMEQGKKIDEIYKKYVEELEKNGLKPRDFNE